MKNILYLEDDHILSFLIKDQLENQGYKVALENRPEAALEQLLQDHFDWIILDIDLSTSISGLDLAEKIRSAGIETPIIFTTGDSKDETLVRIFGLSNCDYIKKTFELPELISRLHRFSNQENTCKKIIHFGPYKLYPNERIIEMGSTKKKLNNQQSLVLCALTDQINHVVTKETLINILWHNSEDIKSKDYALNNIIHQLRKILSQSNTNVQIEYYRRFGVRLNVPIN